MVINGKIYIELRVCMKSPSGRCVMTNPLSEGDVWSIESWKRYYDCPKSKEKEFDELLKRYLKFVIEQLKGVSLGDLVYLDGKMDVNFLRGSVEDEEGNTLHVDIVTAPTLEHISRSFEKMINNSTCT